MVKLGFCYLAPSRICPRSYIFATKQRKMSTGTHRAPLQNTLGPSKSPYLRQHRTNPVAWQEWGPKALQYAQKHNLPIFLSIGYSACHWCHVMEHESFSKESVANVLNTSFVSIKVDREERPDVDRIYMNFVTSSTGSGGWPLNVFLTPNALPIFGGTYWPGPGAKSGQFGRPDFLSIVRKVEKLWANDQDRMLASAESVLDQLQTIANRIEDDKHGSGNVSGKILNETFKQFTKRYDSRYGGFGGAPKFPNEVNISYLLAISRAPKSLLKFMSEGEKNKALNMAIKSLSHIADGGIRDHIGHGFARYSVTRDWSLPHFEKMSYTNSLLMSCFLDAWLITKDQNFLECVVDIAKYFTEDKLLYMNGESIAFFSAEDADSLDERGIKKEGAFYVWTREEFNKVLGSEDAEIAAAYWNVQDDGNVSARHDAHGELEHQNVLCVSKSLSDLAGDFNKSEEVVRNIISDCKGKLHEYRKCRAPPLLDDKILTSWNGLAINSLARASSALMASNPTFATACLLKARGAADFIRKNLYDESSHRLKRVFANGSLGEADGLVDDYSNLISGCIALYEATFESAYLKWAHELQTVQNELFYDTTNGGFYASPAGAVDLIMRMKDDQDNAEPSSNSVSVSNLFRLSILTGDEALREMAEQTLFYFRNPLESMGFAMPEMMKGVMMAVGGVRSVVIHGRRGHQQTDEWIAIVRGRLLPGTVVMYVEGADASGTNDWLLGRSEILKEIRNGKEGVYICEGYSCGLPLQEVESIVKQLES